MTIQNRNRQLFQYKNATRLNAFLDGIYTLVKNYAPDNLENFFDLDAAEGDWLTQLANLFNVPRSYGYYTDAFILDYSELDGPDLLNGTASPITDDILKALFRARIKTNAGTIKSIPYITEVFQTIFTPDYLDVQEGTKSITINIDFGGSVTKLRLLAALNAYSFKWFGCPTATKLIYNITA